MVRLRWPGAQSGIHDSSRIEFPDGVNMIVPVAIECLGPRLQVFDSSIFWVARQDPHSEPSQRRRIP